MSGMILVASVGAAAVLQSGLFAINSLIYIGGTMVITVVVMAIEIFH